MASPYYLGDSRPTPPPTSSASSSAPAPQQAPRQYMHQYGREEDDADDDYGDDDHDGGASGGYHVGGSAAGGGSARSAVDQLQSYQSGAQNPPPSRYFGPQSQSFGSGGGGGGGGVRLPPGQNNNNNRSNPVLFDSGSGTQSPLLGNGGGYGGSSGGAGGAGAGPSQTSIGGLGNPLTFRRNMDDAHASYSTSFSWTLSSACALAYAFPPLTSVCVLILETTNDLARFHAYQAGMLGVGGWLLIWVLRSVLGWYSLSVIVGMGLLGWFWVCASNAANASPTLARVPYLPHVGPLAEQWVGEE
ncbi:unnamed protein product [Tilletia controversa]|uniref:Uncharacterized protein n=2 Tax=Tilletia TaxID=13289 RepID=A0A177VGH0_9BASI|nr:hypothetical protein CF336_g2732 [Tilletia laevis]KAE8243491.1 hypothetical protein A4X03_0g7750 [Tilletia caries]CAD6903041.1 unnamed protein product [Tilletia controversa]KAE8196365.1 hypothetical protein CF335_g4879 [Tilletia laevis]CAD6885655.1 unnamed protein product [Tilletia caries]